MKFLVFAGTTEGKAVIRMLAENKFEVEAFVATEYGQEVLENELVSNEDIEIHHKRLNLEGMKDLFKAQTQSFVVVDATHPYAKEVTLNLKEAANECSAQYIRVLRKSTGSKLLENYSEVHKNLIIEFQNTNEVINWANKEENEFQKILLTTGSKDLQQYTEVSAYNQRIYVRILPDISSLQKAIELNYKKSNIICMQGPFSIAMNEELIKATKTDILITKDTGSAGGFEEKLNAALNLGIKVGIIRRPSDENGNLLDDKGLSVEEFENYIKLQSENRLSSNTETKTICPRFPLFIDLSQSKITVIGGGKIAQRRIMTLLKYGAKLNVITKTVTEELRSLSAQGKIILEQRAYKDGDLKGSFMAIAATDSSEVNQKVYEEALKLDIHISVVDDKSKCSFYFPAVINHENLSIGLVSDGSSHHKTAETARKLRNFLQLEK